LIIPPLFPHCQDKTQEIQWFEDFYDLEQLAQALKFVKLKQFIQQTVNSDEGLLHATNITGSIYYVLW
jgi:hypothetical protein